MTTKVFRRGRVFYDRDRIVGFRLFGWQVDYRIDGWLPFNVRNGFNPDWYVLKVGRGCFTLGRVPRFRKA